jgi:Transmembrane domain of unknown function (DUF3566)
VTDHRDDRSAGTEQVGGSPASTLPATAASHGADPRLEPVGERTASARPRPGFITGQTATVRVDVVADSPAPVRAAGAGTAVDERTEVRVPRVVPAGDPEADQVASPAPPGRPATRSASLPLVVRTRHSVPEEASDVATVSPRPRPIHVRRSKPRVRRVRRVVRSIDTWTVFKVSTIFYLIAYIILLVAGVLLWNLANSTGTVDNVERFFESFGWDSFEFKGGEIFHSYWIIGLFLVVAGTGLNVTLSVLFNLIADLVGGVGVTVLEEEVRVVRVDELPAVEQAGLEPRAPDDPPDAHEPLERDLWNDITGGPFRSPSS